MSLTLITPPAVDPLSLAETKNHLKVDFTEDDALIGGLIKGATTLFERSTNRAIINQTWRYTSDNIPSFVQLFRCPVASIDSAQYIDSDGNPQTIATSNYSVDTDSEPARVAFNSDFVAPTTKEQLNAFTLQFQAGYGAAETDVPEDIKTALLLLIGHWYQNRETAIVSNWDVKEVPLGTKALIWQYKVIAL